MKTTSEIEELVAAETKRRLEEMESPNYEFVQPFLKSDFILIISKNFYPVIRHIERGCTVRMDTKLGNYRRRLHDRQHGGGTCDTSLCRIAK